MSDQNQLRQPATRDAIVHSLARAVERPCARPSCPAPAQATLTFAYATRQATVERLTPEPDPQRYDLCLAHAARTDPPLGWQLTDRRPDDDRVAPARAPVRDLGSSETVQVLAAALRAVPDASADLDGFGDLDDVDDLDPTVELPRIRVPRPVPAAGNTVRPPPAAGR